MSSSATRKPTVVVGLGKTGQACARHLRALGREVVVTDSRTAPPSLDAVREKLPEVRLVLGGFDAELLRNAEEIVISPGVSPREPELAAAVAAGVPLVSEIELFARAAKAPVVAITGSNGKSTVTTLVGLMAARAGLEAAVGGNLGMPALELLRDPEPDLYVLELSSFQLEATRSLAPAAAVVLNISPDHMDRYDGIDDYAAAKATIYRNAAVSVVNADDPAVLAMPAEGRRVRFGIEGVEPDGFGLAQRDGSPWLMQGERPLLAATELKIAGRHNIANALAALALGDAVGLPMEAMLAVLREFQGLPHRVQWIGEAGGVVWLDDSKGTNVGATLAAVRGLERPIVLIAGGDAKGQDFGPLREALAGKARAVVLIGRDAKIIERAIAGAVPVVHAADMDAAVAQAKQLAQAGDAVLLSPACASLDMFRNYVHRGEAFSEAVRRMAL